MKRTPFRLTALILSIILGAGCYNGGDPVFKKGADLSADEQMLTESEYKAAEGQRPLLDRTRFSDIHIIQGVVTIQEPGAMKTPGADLLIQLLDGLRRSFHTGLDPILNTVGLVIEGVPEEDLEKFIETFLQLEALQAFLDQYLPGVDAQDLIERVLEPLLSGGLEGFQTFIANLSTRNIPGDIQADILAVADGIRAKYDRINAQYDEFFALLDTIESNLARLQEDPNDPSALADAVDLIDDAGIAFNTFLKLTYDFETRFDQVSVSGPNDIVVDFKGFGVRLMDDAQYVTGGLGFNSLYVSGFGLFLSMFADGVDSLMLNLLDKIHEKVAEVRSRIEEGAASLKTLIDDLLADLSTCSDIEDPDTRLQCDEGAINTFVEALKDLLQKEQA